MDRVLGIDGGGTKTEAVVVDASGTVLWRDRTGGLDPLAGSDWEARLAVLARAAGPVVQVAVGLPCFGEIEAVTRRQEAVVAAVFGSVAKAFNDVELAFEGVLAGQDGVLVLAGTGSMAWGRGPLGVHRVGGWGDVFGDEGSAFWIGREALARASRELDGRQADSGFATALLAGLGIGGKHLMAWVHALEQPRSGIAALAALVSDLARDGNRDAVALLAEAGQLLADQGLTAARLCGTDARWSFAGGVMADPVVRAVLAERMGSPQAPALPPVGGAVLVAARAAGWRTGTAFIQRLRDGARPGTTEPGP